MRNLRSLLAGLLLGLLLASPALPGGMTVNSYRGGDPFRSDVLLIIDASNKANNTVFTDQSPVTRNLTPAGNAVTTSNVIELDGNEDWVSAADNASWTFAGDFTLEAFGVVFDEDGNAVNGEGQPIMTHYDAFATQRSWSWAHAAGSTAIAGSSNGSSVTTIISYAWTPTPGQPYDMAVVRSGTSWLFYIDGAQVASSTNSISLFNSNTELLVGGRNVSAGTTITDDFRGRMKAVRITNAARYTGSTYAVPKLPLPTFGAGSTPPIPILRAVGAVAATNSGGASVAPAIPTGAAFNDLLLTVCETDSGITISAPTGYASVPDSPQQSATGGTTKLHVFWKRHTGIESAPTVTRSSGDHLICRVAAYRGVITYGDPWDVTAGGSGSVTAGGTITIPGVTTTVPNTLVIDLVSQGTDSSATVYSAWTNASLASPSEAEFFDQCSTTGNGGCLGGSTGGKATAGSVNSTTVTSSSAEATAYIKMALKPAMPAGQGY